MALRAILDGVVCDVPIGQGGRAPDQCEGGGSGGRNSEYGGITWDCVNEGVQYYVKPCVLGYATVSVSLFI